MISLNRFPFLSMPMHLTFPSTENLGLEKGLESCRKRVKFIFLKRATLSTGVLYVLLDVMMHIA